MSFLQQGLGGGPTSEPFAQQGLCAEMERRSYLRGICTAGAVELCAEVGPPRDLRTICMLFAAFLTIRRSSRLGAL